MLICHCLDSMCAHAYVLHAWKSKSMQSVMPETQFGKSPSIRTSCRLLLFSDQFASRRVGSHEEAEERKPMQVM